MNLQRPKGCPELAECLLFGKLNNIRNSTSLNAQNPLLLSLSLSPEENQSLTAFTVHLICNSSPFAMHEESNNVEGETGNGEGNHIMDEYKIVEENKNEQDYEDEVIDVPKVGMVFDTHDDLFYYYCTYGNQKGFEVLRATNKRTKDGVLKYVTVACGRGGKPKQRLDSSIKPQPSKKTRCEAKLNAVLCSNGKWRVSSVVAEHNHPMNPSNSRFFARNRFINLTMKRQPDIDARAGITLNMSFDDHLLQERGHQNLKRARNNIEKERRLKLGEGDVAAVLKYFSKMQSTNSRFFYLMDFDDEGRLKNMFWADERSRVAYEEFGDVIIYDTTYLANKYYLPLTTFVGVNHHGQSILLGCGLISKEDTETFTWLFQAWLACMGGKAPSGIITDQDKEIQNAVEIVFPHSRHRWCLWHIMKKFPEKMRSCESYELISIAFSATVYGSLTPDEFEKGWNDMIEEFHLESNEWWCGLYGARCRWVPAFVKDTFWAGMSTTQQGESMNAYFDGHVNSKTTLKQFVEQYENILRSKLEKEKYEDFKSTNSYIPVISPYAIEEQVQKAYTNAKFQEFQHELRGLICCRLYSSSQEHGSILECDVKEDFVEGSRRRFNFKVWLNRSECKDEVQIKCNCRLFEFRGIVCRHSLAVLIDKEIEPIPDKYILQRWRKDIRWRHKKVRVSYDDWTDKAEWRRFDKMSAAFHEVAELAMESEHSYNIVMNWSKKLLEEVRNETHKSSQPAPMPRVLEDVSVNHD